MSAERRYRYAPRTKKIAVVLGFFFACALFLFVTAESNHRGLSVNGLFQLDPRQADVFLVVLGAISMTLVGLGAFTIVRWRERTQVVVLDTDGMVIPGGPFKDDRRIAWSSIAEVAETSIYRQRFLEIRHAGGKAALAESMLGDAAFAELRAILAERTAPLPAARVVT